MKLNKTRGARSSAQTVGWAKVHHWAQGASRIVNTENSTYHTFAIWDRRGAMGYEPSSITIVPFHGTGRARKCSMEDHGRADGDSARAGLPQCSMDGKVSTEFYWLVSEVETGQVCGAVHEWHQGFTSVGVLWTYLEKLSWPFYPSTILKLRLKRRQDKPWQEQPLFSLTF